MLEPVVMVDPTNMIVSSGASCCNEEKSPCDDVDKVILSVKVEVGDTVCHCCETDGVFVPRCNCGGSGGCLFGVLDFRRSFLEKLLAGLAGALCRVTLLLFPTVDVIRGLPK